MSLMGERRLVSIRRLVPTERLEEYVTLWMELRTAVMARGAHAWSFASEKVPNVYLEFLEFGRENDVRSDPEIVEAIRKLHETFGQPYPPPNTIEEWVETPMHR